MPRPVDNARPGACVNVLKKVRTSGGWKLCPAVREANGRLRDRVRVAGRTEVHSEGVYYLEWREASRRRREAIPNPAEVLERARLKSIEIEARRVGVAFDIVRIPEPPRSSPMSDHAENGAVIDGAPPPHTNAERLLVAGIEAYIKERVDTALRARLCLMGVTAGGELALASLPEPKLLAAPEKPEQNRSEEVRGQPNASNADGDVTIAEAIDAYLKDVEPPQREFKTYEEYRNVLYRFRDSCKKKLIKEIDRKDCLEFMRHLYSIGNEARTVYSLSLSRLQCFDFQGVNNEQYADLIEPLMVCLLR